MKNPSSTTKQLQLDSNRLIRLPEVLTIIPVKKSTWWLWCKQGRAPAPVRLGRCTFWRYGEVISLIEGV
jgi:predicted DNA-binding transcriptional regulator AlpA